MWNTFVECVDTDSETLNGQSHCHRQLLDDNLKWQRKVEELAGHHEQRIADLEVELKNKTSYIKSIEITLAELLLKVDTMEGKLCCCNEIQVEEEDYHTPMVVAGLIEDIPRLIPIGDVEVTPGGFDEEVRDGEEGSDMELESVASKVMEQALEEEEDSSEGTDIKQFMYPVGPVCLCPLDGVQAY